jgi:hypothetical protein
MLADLREEILSLVSRLDSSQKWYVLALLWNQAPHARLLPLIESLGLAASEYWCQDWPNECSAAILADVQKPTSNLPYVAILRIPEAERPELDAFLKRRLTSTDQMQNSWLGPQTAALVLRAGSRNLLGSVDAALDAQPSGFGKSCEVEGFLLGYLFRVAPPDAQRRLAATLNDEHDSCGSQVFRVLLSAKAFEPMIPVAAAALYSSNLEAAGTAALFLGEKGSESAKDMLYRRLTLLREQWHDRAEEVRAAFLPDDIRTRSAQLERSLASALAHGRTWSLTVEEHESLKAGCFTEQCKDIVQGTLGIGL